MDYINSNYFEIYNPDPLKVTKFTLLMNQNNNNEYLTKTTVSASTDGVNYTSLGTYTNSSLTWNLTLSSTGFYKYYKFSENTVANGSQMLTLDDLGITATYMTGVDIKDALWASPSESQYIIRAY